MATTRKQIKSELKKLGIKNAIVGDATVDGSPAVLLRWNGKEEYVTSTHLALGEEDIRDESDDRYIEWLKSTYADANLQ
jgi:hypothetical protein